MNKNKTQVILDFGSGETCRNDKKIIRKMIDTLVEEHAKSDNKTELIIKWQLFEQETIPGLLALDKKCFDYAYRYGTEIGINKMTASVFDEKSLNHLLQYDVPFIKIAANPKYWYIAHMIPTRIKTYLSTPSGKGNIINLPIDMLLACIRKYPAKVDEYKNEYNDTGYLRFGISDHTDNFNLYHEYKKTLYVYETHYKLPDSEGADNGPWAKTAAELKEIL